MDGWTGGLAFKREGGAQAASDRVDLMIWRLLLRLHGRVRKVTGYYYSYIRRWKRLDNQSPLLE